MSRILHIETAVQGASICLAENGRPLAVAANPVQKESAAWLHVAIAELLGENGVPLTSLDAIAVSAGPGSYTGLRVGMAAAKGLCYALQLPLISINTLQMMAAAARAVSGDAWLCPMIDARRMEVFTAVFDSGLHTVMPATNLILDETSYAGLLSRHPLLFFGNGSAKFAPLAAHPHARFAAVEATAAHLAGLALEKFTAGNFADLAYATPFYGKDFHSPAQQSL